MHKRLKIVAGMLSTCATIGVLCAAGAVAAPAPAAGSIDLRDTPLARANPALTTEVLESLPAVLLKREIHVDEDFRPGTPIVYGDGTPVPGQGPERMQAASRCGNNAYGPPWGGWGRVTTGCGIAGHPGFKLAYAWSKLPNVSTRGCTEVRGWVNYEKKGFSAGCGQRGGATVPWGNVLANSAARTRSISVPAGFSMSWRN